jgi:hypothetical protein
MALNSSWEATVSSVSLDALIFLKKKLKPTAVLARSWHSLSWAKPINFLPHPVSCIFILILPSFLILGLPRVLFASVSHPKTYTNFSSVLFPHACIISRFLFDHPNDIFWGVQFIRCFIMQFLKAPFYLPLPGPNIFLSTLFSITFKPCFSFTVKETKHTHHTKQQVRTCFFVYIFLNINWEGKYFLINGSKNSLSSVPSEFLRTCHFDLLVTSPIILTLPHFQNFYYLFLGCEVF